jgi:hypothetical protein
MRALVGLTFAAAQLGASGSANAHVSEVSAPWLDDIAAARITASGAVIYVNLARCKEVGPHVCAFVRQHEQAHVLLNHGSSFYTSYVNGRALAEAEADCWAAKNSLLVSVKAAVAHFESPQLAKVEVGEHGTGLERARRIKACRGL